MKTYTITPILGPSAPITSLILFISLISMISMTLSACGVRPLTPHERAQVEEPLADRAVELITLKRLPDQTPMRDIELTRALLRAHPRTARYLPPFYHDE